MEINGMNDFQCFPFFGGQNHSYAPLFSEILKNRKLTVHMQYTIDFNIGNLLWKFISKKCSVIMIVHYNGHHMSL